MLAVPDSREADSVGEDESQEWYKSDSKKEWCRCKVLARDSSHRVCVVRVAARERSGDEQMSRERGEEREGEYIY